MECVGVVDWVFENEYLLRTLLRKAQKWPHTRELGKIAWLVFWLMLLPGVFS